MDLSWLQRIKEALSAVLPGEVVLIALGLGCYLLTCLVARKPLVWAWALLPGLLLSLAIETWEIWDHWGAEGLAKSSAGQILAILGRHARDVAIVNLPALALFGGALWFARSVGR